MLRTSRPFLAVAVPAVALGILAVGAPTAEAVPLFLKQWTKTYLSDETSEEYTTLVKSQAKCLVCHQGRSKKNFNAYGEQLRELIGKREKDSDKIAGAFEKVAKMPIDPKDKEGPVFGDMIKADRLPGGELEDLKKEPVKD